MALSALVHVGLHITVESTPPVTVSYQLGCALLAKVTKASMIMPDNLHPLADGRHNTLGPLASSTLEQKPSLYDI